MGPRDGPLNHVSHVLGLAETGVDVDPGHGVRRSVLGQAPPSYRRPPSWCILGSENLGVACEVTR